MTMLFSHSPHVGGSDGIITARNYGFNIKFKDNHATAAGGAIFTERNMRLYGAGGASGPLVGLRYELRCRDR